MSADAQKRAAAHEAVERFVRSGATLGLGSGTTAAFVVERIGEKLIRGELRDVRGIPTSEATAELAGKVGIPLVGLAEARPDVVLDGADEVTEDLTAIKGYGGALLREKIVAASSRTGLVMVVDDAKKVDALGTRGPLPVEVEPYGWESTLEALAALGSKPERRMDWNDPGVPFATDGGHYTIDCSFGAIEDPASLQTAINNIPGALECGLFIGLARAAVVAGEAGTEVFGK